MKDIPEIDQGLYSRQLYVLGKNAMQRLGQCDVLISGLGGLGVEIAKNVILAGVQSVTLHDQQVVKCSDLSSQFFVSEADLGRNRAEATQEKLAALNKYVKVHSSGESLNDSLIMKHGAVILTNSTPEENLRIGNLCHENKIYFLSTCVAGIFGQIFCDFGVNFLIKDKFDQSPTVAKLVSIRKAEDEDVLEVLLEEKTALFAENDFVTFENVQNLDQINGCKPIPIKEIKSRQLFTIENVNGITQYGEGGTVKEVRMQEAIEYKCYGESLSSPKYSSNDVFQENLLHVAFQVLKKFQAKHGHLPRAHSEVDALEFVEMGSNLMKELDLEVEMDEELFKIFSKCSSGSLSPVCSVIGSISAQEIIKAITRKFEPINQWFYFSACEILPPDFDELTEEECSPRGSRYDGQIAIFGAKRQQAIMDAKLFLVGAGAIGCETLKNWAMMGIGSGKDGRACITDMDMIEKSNLNRQFLFRPEHIGKMKSVTASEMVKKLVNPNIKVEAYESKVSTETEDIFDDRFFESFDVIVNALDNIPARLYMADKCVYHHKPLLESGTEGTTCHVQVILPGLTCSYSNRESPNETIPLCTLKYFPTSIEHTIQWARDDFEGCFKLDIKTAHDFLVDDNFVANTRKLPGSQQIERLQEILEVFEGFSRNGPEELEDITGYEMCIKWARIKFERHFNNQIQQLRFNFPPDAKTKEGQPFWRGSKKCPMPISFDPNEPLHMDFITSAANLLASALGLKICKTREESRKYLASVHIPHFQPGTKVFIPANDEEAQQNKENKEEAFDDDEFHELLKKLPDVQFLRSINLKLQSIDFEKDGEDNFHVDFVTSSSNLRAINYGINPIDKLETKRIVGKIIPAIATTTSLVVGLVCLELLKILTGQMNLKKFKNWFCRMSSNFVQRSNVKQAKKFKYKDLEFTIWNNFTFDEDITLEHLVETLKTKHEVDVDSIFCGPSSLLSFYTPNKEKRLKMKVSEAIREVAGPLAPHVCSVLLDIIPPNCDQLPFVKVKLV